MPVVRKRMFTKQDFINGKCTAEGFPVSKDTVAPAMTAAAAAPDPEPEEVQAEEVVEAEEPLLSEEEVEEETKEE